MQTPNFDNFNTILSVIANEDGGPLKTCIRLPMYDILIHPSVPRTIFEEMKASPTHADNLPINDDPYHEWTRVVRVVNGRVIFCEMRRDDDGNTMICPRKYFQQLVKWMTSKHEAQPIGFMSTIGIYNAIKIARQIQDDGELRSFVDLFDKYDLNMTLIHNECGFEDSCIIITQDMIDAGLTHYYENYYKDVCHYIRDDFLVKRLRIGDAIIIRKNADGSLWHKLFIKDEFELLYELKKEDEGAVE
jgi:hypothetical protein